ASTCGKRSVLPSSESTQEPFTSAPCALFTTSSLSKSWLATSGCENCSSIATSPSCSPRPAATSAKPEALPLASIAACPCTSGTWLAFFPQPGKVASANSKTQATKNVAVLRWLSVCSMEHLRGLPG